MQAIRKQAARIALPSRPKMVLRPRRSYASDSHDHHHHAAHQVNEGLGTGFYVLIGVIPVSMFLYRISRPGADGTPPALTRWLAEQQFAYWADSKEKDLIRNRIIDQAVRDKHLFLHSAGPCWVDLKTPELISQGSPYCIPAGHYINTDHVTEHYRKRFHEREERKAKLLAAEAAAEASKRA